MAIGPKTFEELQEMLEHPERFNEDGSKKKAKTTGKGQAAPDKPFIPDDDVYMELHFYTRPDDNWNNVLACARDERKVRNKNVLVFAHNHVAKDECVNSCKQLLPGQDDAED